MASGASCIRAPARPGNSWRHHRPARRSLAPSTTLAAARRRKCGILDHLVVVQRHDQLAVEQVRDQQLHVPDLGIAAGIEPAAPTRRGRWRAACHAGSARGRGSRGRSAGRGSCRGRYRPDRRRRSPRRAPSWRSRSSTTRGLSGKACRLCRVAPWSPAGWRAWDGPRCCRRSPQAVRATPIGGHHDRGAGDQRLDSGRGRGGLLQVGARVVHGARSPLRYGRPRARIACEPPRSSGDPVVGRVHSVLHTRTFTRAGLRLLPGTPIYDPRSRSSRTEHACGSQPSTEAALSADSRWFSVNPGP